MKALSKIYRRKKKKQTTMVSNISHTWVHVGMSDVTQDGVSFPQGRGPRDSASKGPCLCGTQGSAFRTIFCYPFQVGANLEMISSHRLVGQKRKVRKKVLGIIAWGHIHWPDGVIVKPRSPVQDPETSLHVLRLRNGSLERDRFFFLLLALHRVNSNKGCDILA